ncbi:hypothetical protein A176_007505 [Myxococcus hansupus]|uniref:Outer membrane protein beta-barrel domain-containing protein n=1 Tax=Pseudomyxococcus hansupus TaxID=1297742 RepID=A0A0H4X9C3_9BACT|nr:hypothetical protein [Myxococcus hansupus]AKQ70593.1 hypothetical protein A176_007505 [Myxococcus hansupus]
MPASKAVLCAALAAGVLALGPTPAEARFGKRSASSSSSSGKSSSSSSSSASSSSRSASTRPASAIGQSREGTRASRRPHGASAIGQPRASRGGDAPRRRAARVRRLPPSYIVAGSVMGATGARLGYAAPARVAREQEEAVALLVRMGVQGDRLGDGGAMGLFMAMDGRRLGVDARMTGLTLPATDGASTRDRITLLSAHATAALWAGERGRMRLEAGVASAHAPSIIFAGPSFGASVEACIGASPVDVEARVQAVPFPHRQVDAQAGLAVHISSLHLRGGWRALYLNDAGHTTGEPQIERLSGPYLGLGFTF